MGITVDDTDARKAAIKEGKGPSYYEGNSTQVAWKYLDQPLFTKKKLKVIILGFGFSGIEMAYKLSRESPQTEYVIYEKSHRLGGTWNHNTYPGVGCDSATVSYQFAWNLNPNWTKVYADGDDIRKYMEATVEKFKLMKGVHLGHNVSQSKWDEKTAKWTVDVTGPDGKTFQDSGDLLCCFTGNIHNPHYPHIPGREESKAKVVHTAAWDNTLDCTGKRVAVIGNGSSAVQVIPSIIDQVAKLDLYQRTPAWILPKFRTGTGPLAALMKNEAIETTLEGYYTEAQRKKFADDSEYYYQVVRKSDAQLSKNLMAILKKDSPVQKLMREATLFYMEEKVKDPELRKLLIPDFELNCRRVAPNDDYLDALQHPSASVLRAPLKAFSEHGLEREDGSVVDYDIIICATGYDNSYIPRFPVIGKDGLTMKEHFQKEPEAFLGMVTTNFPNYYFSMGPNSPLSNGSASGIITVMVSYILKVIAKMEDEQIRTIEFKEDKLKAWNEQIQSMMPDFVWSGRCNSWYKNPKSGRVTAPYPGSMLHYALVGAEPRWEDYDINYEHKNPYAWYGNGWPIGEAEETIEDPVPYFRHPSKYLP